MLARALAPFALAPFALAGALVVVLATGCAINTDPILQDEDAGRGAPDTGAFPGAADAGSFDDGDSAPPSIAAAAIEPYTGCDVDLECTDGCADDLDCATEEDGGHRLPAMFPPFSETADDGAPFVLEPGAELWFELGTIDVEWICAAVFEAGDAAMAAYDPTDGRLLARSTNQPAIVLGHEVDDRVERAILRVVAGPEGATFTLRRQDLPAEDE